MHAACLHVPTRTNSELAPASNQQSTITHRSRRASPSAVASCCWKVRSSSGAAPSASSRCSAASYAATSCRGGTRGGRGGKLAPPLPAGRRRGAVTPQATQETPGRHPLAAACPPPAAGPPLSFLSDHLSPYGGAGLPPLPASLHLRGRPRCPRPSPPPAAAPPAGPPAPGAPRPRTLQQTCGGGVGRVDA